MEFRPLNQRGRILAELFQPILAAHPHWEEFGPEAGILAGRLKPLPELFLKVQKRNYRALTNQAAAFRLRRSAHRSGRAHEGSWPGSVSGRLKRSIAARAQNSNRFPGCTTKTARKDLGD